jgi:hypothetical protein
VEERGRIKSTILFLKKKEALIHSLTSYLFTVTFLPTATGLRLQTMLTGSRRQATLLLGEVEVEELLKD